MTKEKLKMLERYVSELISKLNDAVPEKHKNRAKEYHQFLQFELTKTKAKVDEAKIAGLK